MFSSVKTSRKHIAEDINEAFIQDVIDLAHKYNISKNGSTDSVNSPKNTAPPETTQPSTTPLKSTESLKESTALPSTTETSTKSVETTETTEDSAVN